MNRQVRAIEEPVACDVCGRTMLKGERTEPYLAPSRERKLVCSLCAPRAQQEGWIRESAGPATPAQPPREPERRKRLRLGLRQRPAARPQGGDPSEHDAAEPVWADADERAANSAPPKRQKRLPRDPRHVRAVPTNSQLKLERAIELFNTSEHLRTVTGLARTLGPPQVSATASGGSAAEVLLTVAWDISWYQFVVDLSDSSDPVRVESQGQEISELTEVVRNWNARVEADGSLAIDSEEVLNGEEPEQGL
jgi:hypothetical protein